MFAPDKWDCYSILSSSTVNHELALLGNKHQIFFSLAQALLAVLTAQTDHLLALDSECRQLCTIIQNHQELLFIYLNNEVLLSVYDLFDDPSLQLSLPALHQVVLRWKDQHKNKRSTNQLRKYKLDFYLPFASSAADQLLLSHHADESPCLEVPSPALPSKKMTDPVSQGDTDASQLNDLSPE